MKIEVKILIYSMINNLVIAIIKLIGGIFFQLGSLVADGMHTFSDFITDIICLIGSKIAKKKPTKYHPFGFGRVEYLTNLFVGIILFILAIFIIISSFFKEPIIPPLSILILLLVVFILKLLAILIMYKVGKKINSNILITSVRESKADLYSTIGVAVITIILQFSNQFSFLKYIDILGAILIGLIVLKTALKIIIDNSLCLIGEVENNLDTNNELNEIIEKYKNIEDYNYKLIKYGTYYRLQINVILNSNLTLRQTINLLNKLKKDIKRHRSLKVKFVTILVTDNLEG